MFSRLKIASKLLIGFSAILLLLIGISALATISSMRSKDALENVTKLKGDEVLEQRVEKRVFEARMHFWIALGSGDSKHWNKSGEGFAVADEWLDDLLASTTDAELHGNAQKMSELVKGYRKLANRLRFAQQQDGSLSADAIKAATADAAKIEDSMTMLGEELSTQYRNASEATVAEAKESASYVQTLIFWAGSAGITLGILLSLVFTRSIGQPIIKLTRVMKSLATGDLNVSLANAADRNEIGEMAKAILVFRDAAIEKARLEEEAAKQRLHADDERNRNEQGQREAIARERATVADSVGAGLSRLAAKDLTYRMSRDIPDAYRKLQMDFNAAISQLEEAMLGVVGSADAIHSGSQEISAATADLSRRTEQQAASLEETAATLDQVTATVRKAAESTIHARKVVATAQGDAQKSGEVIRKAVAAMGAIEKSSQQISQIIGVIDEIAFQTSLLALNAGVEAARAGDAGRGFAVVASEVRALAQRSAEAAKEIKGLISTSTTQVSHGVALVAETGSSLERIMAQVTEINNVVSEIAAGAKEQSTALEEVNSAINQMDQVTQQNAAMVEQSTAASYALAEETEQLSVLIGQFQVGGREEDDPIRRQLQEVAPHAFPAKSATANGARLDAGDAPRRPVRASLVGELAGVATGAR
ncbi:methyl-accepting chemotaxis protein [Methylocapsa sp. S129]|uniref:methyl-accepting chemotaxis protein n=1 Tax=Methylocapsa sp. S129 TaxID=1641869 RepID=UPI00131C3495|nr:methyl-accepting chemotaxis protein [Methylocapsa sp. S129]